MTILTVTNDGIAACADANEGGFRIVVSNFKIGDPPTGFPVSTSNEGTFVGTNDGMTKDGAGVSYVKYEGSVSLVQVLTSGAVQFTLHLPPGIPGPGESYDVREIGLYLDNGRLFAHGEIQPAYPKTSEAGVEIRAIVVLTQLCDVINVTMGDSCNLPSTVVRQLEPPKPSQHNAIVVLDQNNNQDTTTSPSLALQYGPGNEAWGFVDHTRIFLGPTGFDSNTKFTLNPVVNGFWLLDGEPLIVQIVADSVAGETGPSEGQSRRMVFNATTYEFTELDGKPFSIQAGVSTPIIAIWRDPAWMLSRYGGQSDLQVKGQEFHAEQGDYVFDLTDPVRGVAIVHCNTVHQTDSWYITPDGMQLVFKEPLFQACDVFIKWIELVPGIPSRAIKFKRINVVPNGGAVYNLSAFVSTLVATEDKVPLVYGASVFQHEVDYDPDYRTLDFGTGITAAVTPWIETVFFERHLARGLPVLQKFTAPGGRLIYKSALPIADEDHVLVFVGQVYQRTLSFTVLDAYTVLLHEMAPPEAEVTLFVSSVIGAVRNVPLWDEYVKLREYVFCKLGRPDERYFELMRVFSNTSTVVLPEQVEYPAEVVITVARNVFQTQDITFNGAMTELTVSEPVAPETLQAVQVLNRANGRTLYKLERISHTTVQGQRQYNLAKPARDRAMMLCLLGQVPQTTSFSLVNGGKSILFSEDPPPGIDLTITQFFNDSAVNGPFLVRDQHFMSTGGKSFYMDTEIDSKDSLIVMVGTVFQEDFQIEPDNRTFTLSVNVPEGLPVTVKHIHHRCYEANVTF